MYELMKEYKGINISFNEDFSLKNLAGTKIQNNHLSTRNVLNLQ